MLIKKGFVVLSLLSSIALAGCTSVESHTVTPEVPAIKQEQTYWCWAATGVGILKHQGKTISQSDFATKALGAPLDVPIHDHDFMATLGRLGVDSLWTNPLTEEQMKNQINENLPVVLGIRFKDNGVFTDSGHMFTVYDYTKMDESFEIGYIDPSDGARRISRYDYVKNNELYTVENSLVNFTKNENL